MNRRNRCLIVRLIDGALADMEHEHSIVVVSFTFEVMSRHAGFTRVVQPDIGLTCTGVDGNRRWLAKHSEETGFGSTRSARKAKC